MVCSIKTFSPCGIVNDTKEMYRPCLGMRFKVKFQWPVTGDEPLNLCRKMYNSTLQCHSQLLSECQWGKAST